jgi:predicted nucleic acid-binding protein
MILVDSSVWIDFFARRTTPQTQILLNKLQSDDLCTCAIVLTEVLQGFRLDSVYGVAKDIFADLVFLDTTSTTSFAAADLYRSLRKKGVTIRKTNDCIIAAVAIEHRVTLLHSDRDFELIAAHSPLKVFPI